ncbi:MAG TPA: cytochrome c biogenesis protein CcsA [Anaerolineales bacterium]|nr:cytochrome c biogenesis protein CcsA [Anaerolineales bacterium]
MEPKSRWLKILDGVTVVLFVIAVGMVFFYAPTEATMGQVQRVFYFHVATAWVGMLGFLVAAIVGVIYLIRKEHRWDIAGLAAVEISLVFFFIAIVSGSIWARPTWGTWWTWDPRLTTATIVELVYAAYLLLRSGIEDPDRRARFGAVYSILGFLSVPLTFVSIRLLRTIHPVVIGGGNANADGDFSMTPKMLQTFMFSLFVFSVIFVDLLWHRIRLGRLADKVEQLRLKIVN